MICVLLIAAVVVGWAVKQALGPLIGQEARGSVPAYTRAKAASAATLLPEDLCESYLEDWLAELGALEDRPLSALRYANGLAPAARVLTVQRGGPITYSRRFFVLHRAADLTFCAIGITAIAPLLATLVVGTRVITRGPGLCRRQRLGKDGIGFGQLALATRVRGLGPRASRWGRVMEETSLDMLPVFINVLRGDMSLVGPPPQRLPSPNAPLKVRPGMVSWEVLVRSRCSVLTLEQARARDQERRLRHDLALFAHVVRMVLSPQLDH